MSPGRSCPLDYRYRASDIAHAPLPEGLRGLETLYVVGGLYGNPEALAAVLAAFEAEPGGRRKALVFNGDFHWFDAEPDGFATVQAAVMRHWATRGNVETELAREQIGAAGCGCAYPDFVDSATVAHSNRIIERLHAAVPAGQRAVLAALPPFLRAEVAGMAVGIVHGDAESLAAGVAGARRGALAGEQRCGRHAQCGGPGLRALDAPVAPAGARCAGAGPQRRAAPGAVPDPLRP